MAQPGQKTGDDDQKKDELRPVLRAPSSSTLVLDCASLQSNSEARNNSFDGPELGSTSGERSFVFDRVYQSFELGSPDHATQATLMEELGEEMKECILNGYNTCLLAYGQTGSGKTFSILGNDKAPENRGLLPRIVGELFRSIEKETSEGTGDFS